MIKYQTIQIGLAPSCEWAVLAIDEDGSRKPVSKHATEAEARSEINWLYTLAMTSGRTQ